ncbi:MAG TPA: YjbH domain-containing protein [Paenirhodobacter sp.]
MTRSITHAGRGANGTRAKRRANLRGAKIAGVLGVFSVAIGAAVPAGHAEPMIGASRGTFGMAGLIDMPTAEVRPDGELGLALSWFKGGTQRNNITFQISPRITGAFRYSRVPGLMPDDDNPGTFNSLYDRSFDIHFQFLDEGQGAGWMPAMAVGIRDFVGTGAYASEYIVATKSLTPALRITAGLGWGRLGSSGSIGSTGDRPDIDYTSTGGKYNGRLWLRGDVAPFFGVSYALNDDWTLKAEYSSDSYAQEEERSDFERKTRFNIGADYRVNELLNAQIYYLNGDKVGVQFALNIDPKNPPFPSGIEKMPLPVRPRPAPAADPEGWSGAWADDPTAQPTIQGALAQSLKKDGQILESMSLTSTRAELRVRNETYGSEAQAVGHVVRMATRALPPSVETIVVTPMKNGVPLSSLSFNRSDIERLENTNSAEIAQRMTITGAKTDKAQVLTPEVYPRFQWALTPYVDATFFDADDPFRIDTGAELAARYEFVPGLIFSGALRQKILGNRDKSDRVSDSVVYHVRSDQVEYDKHGDLTIPRLQAAFYSQPVNDIYARVTVGLLEQMYGGVSTELLWKPVDSRLALGIETNWVQQRDFDQRFSFRDYTTITGHVSAYYDIGKGYTAQIDYGRYLARDWGTTITLDREFENGWKVGAFASFTDMSSDDFGEGSFDKGIQITIPIAWATGKPTLGKIDSVIRPLTRDGGAKLDIDGRLYETIRNAHTGDLYDGWGRFWR